MVYVDLNPVRADLECRLEECRDSSASRRLRENSAEALEDYLRPLTSGLEDSWGNERQEEPTEPPQQDEGLQQDEFEEPRMEEAPREHATGALSSNDGGAGSEADPAHSAGEGASLHESGLGPGALVVKRKTTRRRSPANRRDARFMGRLRPAWT